MSRRDWIYDALSGVVLGYFEALLQAFFQML
jgi:hypothetical protein